MGEKKWTPDQQRVIDLRDRNILVSAAAGSGKTAVLVQRIIEMITDQNHPMDIDELLVVTFTNAAAREMKERVRTAIEKALEEHPGDTHLIRQETLVGAAHISTIDSFCLQVIRNHFHEIGLDPEFHTADQNEIKLLKNTLMEQFLEAKYRAGEESFLQTADIYSSKGKDTELSNSIFQLMNMANSYPWPKKWLDEAKQVYEITSVEELKNLAWMKKCIERYQLQCKEIRDGYQSLLDYISDTPGAPECRIELLKKDLIYVEYLMEAGNIDDYILRISSHGRFDSYRALKKDDPSNPEIDAYIKAKREGLKTAIQSLEKEIGSQTLQDIYKTIKVSQPVAEELIQLTKEYMDLFAAEKRKKNIIDFTDQEHFALQILVDEETGEPTEAAREYTEQFREIMIDEYQDSNDVQELLLSSVSKQSVGGHNYFMVGDVKQSIYGFRMARPRIFMGKYASYSELDGVEQKIDLNKNFRSRREVLDFTNELFYELMQPDLGDVAYTDKEALYLGAEYYDDADKLDRENHPEISEEIRKQYYEPEVIVGSVDEDLLSDLELDDKHEFEAYLIAKRIQDMMKKDAMRIFDPDEGCIRPVRYRDIVILLRSTSSKGEKYVEVLKKFHIPVQVASTAGYFEATEVKTVLSFLSLLDNQYQDIPLAALLHSPIIGMTNEELLQIRATNPKADFSVVFYEYAKNHAEDEKIKKYLDLLISYREKALYLSIHELLEAFLEETKYLLYVTALPDGAVRKANLEKLVDMAISYEHSSFKGLFRFVNYIEEAKKYESEEGAAEVISENDDAVRIMTIHKSKGLEFPIVFVSEMGQKIGHVSKNRNLIHGDYGMALESIDPIHRVKYNSFYRKAMSEMIKLEERGEELRILYVALTRAREKLIITGVMKSAEEKTEDMMRDMGPMTYIRRSSASTYLDWILPVLFYKNRERYITIEDETTMVAKTVLEMSDRRDKKAWIENLPEVPGQFDFQYPYPYISKYKNKYSVSEIKHQAMDILLEMEDAGKPEELHIPSVPTFLQDQMEANQGALRGTAMHRYMECFDFYVEGMASSFEQQLERMMEEGKVTEEQKNMISKSQIQTFLNSHLAERMHCAALKENLFIERAFVFGDKPSRLFSGIDQEEPMDPAEEPLVMVQGIIDAFFMEEDGIVLLDYKTDRVKTKEQLADLYRKQIDIYADAISRAYQMPVKERYLYSFSLGDVVAV